MSLKPTKDKIIVKPIFDTEKTESGIILSSTKSNSFTFATVEAIGTEVKNIKLGDKVIFNENYKKIIYDDIELFIIAEEDILAVEL